MFDQVTSAKLRSEVRSPRDWVKVLAHYREPNTWRSIFEFTVTIGPFVGLWALAWWSMSLSYWLAFGISILNAAFLLRLFAIQHDCGHGAFWGNNLMNNWLGRFLGVLTLTPYDVWKQSHSIHHGSTGNLERRGYGDIHTMTVSEYLNKSPRGRMAYRLYRHPIVLFGFGPAYLFLFQNRLPLGFMERGRFWVSALGTNAALLLILGLIYYFGGLAPLLLIFLPSTLLAATAGMWLFYVQHQFEDTYWNSAKDWQIHEAALEGSSYYVMPSVLQWISANIGIHHVHHLYSRIPFYRLPEVLKDHSELTEFNRLTIRESFGSLFLDLWDEDSRKLLSFAEVRARQDCK